MPQNEVQDLAITDARCTKAFGIAAAYLVKHEGDPAAAWADLAAHADNLAERKAIAARLGLASTPSKSTWRIAMSLVSFHLNAPAIAAASTARLGALTQAIFGQEG